MKSVKEALDEVDRALSSCGPIEPMGTKNQQAPWPEPMGEAAFHGIIGEIARKIEPETEADITAVLIQLLVAFGNVIGRGPYFLVEGDKHHTNLFATLVGSTSKGRKGTSWGRARSVFEKVDETWSGSRLVSCMSTGEGLISQVCDRVEKERSKKNGKVDTEVIVEGVTDKRLLVQESEFASVLKVMARSGNTLSARVRDAWDRGDLGSMTKNDPLKATNAHISIVAHITDDELRRYLDRTETGNGFANRFLFVCVQRSKFLPDGGQDIDWGDLIEKLAEIAQRAKDIGQMTRTAGASKLWHEVYPKLSEGRPGLMGAVTARAEAQVLRLSMIYALADGSQEIDRPHLEAALEVWRYCEASARYVFGEQLGDPLADEILQRLRAAPEGMTQTELSNSFGRHTKSNQLARALEFLTLQHMVRSEEVETGGRPTTRWVVA